MRGTVGVRDRVCEKEREGDREKKESDSERMCAACTCFAMGGGLNHVWMRVGRLINVA